MNSTDLVRGAEGLYAVGYWLLEQGNVADAASVLRTLVTVVPNDERGYLALGVCHEQVDQPEVALEIYSVGAMLGATTARCHLAKARLLRGFGQRDEACEAYELAAEAAEDDAELADTIRAEQRDL